MQLLSRYLVKNRIDIIADVAGFVTEYRPVYKRQIQVYKGIDNILEFRLLNADQKPINTEGYTPKFRAFDESNQMVLEKTGTVLDDGSSATKGLFIVNVTENELLNLKQQFLSYNIYLVDSAGDNVLTYTDTHFGMDAVIKISSEAFPGPKDSISATSFTETGVGSGVWTSSSIDAQPGINGNEALHTAAVYTSAYTGNVVVQATLDNQVSDGTQWADIATLTFDGTETLPKPISYNGVFSYVRFKADANPNDKITKVLVRN